MDIWHGEIGDECKVEKGHYALQLDSHWAMELLDAEYLLRAWASAFHDFGETESVLFYALQSYRRNYIRTANWQWNGLSWKEDDYFKEAEVVHSLAVDNFNRQDYQLVAWNPTSM